MAVAALVLFSVVSGAQTAQLNSVLYGNSNEDSTCPVTRSFVDRQGNTYGQPRHLPVA